MLEIHVTKYFRQCRLCCIVIEFNSSPLDNIVAILQTIFSDVFCWMKSFVFLYNFYWSLSKASNW